MIFVKNPTIRFRYYNNSEVFSRNMTEKKDRFFIFFWVSSTVGDRKLHILFYSLKTAGAWCIMHLILSILNAAFTAVLGLICIISELSAQNSLEIVQITDSNGNQDFYRLCHFCLHLIKSSQSSGVCVCCHKAMNASEYASSPVPFPKSGSFFIHSVNLFINLRQIVNNSIEQQNKFSIRTL